MDNEIVLKALDEFVYQSGSQKEAAKKLGLSRTYINDLCQRRKSVSEVVAEKLGFHAIWKRKTS